VLLSRTKSKKGKSRSRNKAKDGRRNIVGARVRQIRRAAKPKITQEDLAGRVAALQVGLDRTAIFRIESGLRSVSDIELAALARALRVSVATLFPTDTVR
jgi:HTH-type transcriptional regulator, cell division transcriptional repressor